MGLLRPGPPAVKPDGLRVDEHEVNPQSEADQAAELPGEDGDQIRLACLDQVNRAVLRSSPAAPFIAASLILVFGDQVLLRRMVAWSVTVTAFTALWVGSAALYLHRRRRGDRIGRWLAGPACAALVGAAWASLPFLVDVPAGNTNLRDVYLLYLTALAAGNAVGAAGRRDYFFSFQLALLVPTEIACLTAPDRTTRYIGLAVPIYFVVMAVLHDEVHSVVISELTLRFRMNDANRELRALNAQLGEIALRDDLTGAANRVAFVDALGEAVGGIGHPAEAARLDGSSAADIGGADPLSEAAVRGGPGTSLVTAGLPQARSGLPQARSGLAQARSGLAQARSDPAQTRSGLQQARPGVAIVFLDIDHFKVVNDSLGHQAGDELLVKTADRIRQVLREGDVLARLGGDEFTVLLRDLGDLSEAVDTAHRVHRVFDAPFCLLGLSVPVTASVGVAFSAEGGVTPQELLRQADEAQYEAKERGRNRVEVFTPTLRPSTRRRLDREDELRRALSQGEIIAYFQPQVDLVTGRVVGAEALARWNHPTRGILSAAEFVPLAEQSDLILEVDAAIRSSAIAARVALADAGCAPQFRIWCNVSAHQLTTADPIADLVTQVEAAGCDPSGVGVELTETAVMAQPEAAAAQMERVRGLSVRVALDDFGTGHSSLALLRSMSVDELKIDRTFVAGMMTSGRDLAIVRAMCTIGREVGLVIVAEGVETLAQASMLTRLGCDRAQGFLWSPAVPLGELLVLVRSAFPTAAGPPGRARKLALGA